MGVQEQSCPNTTRILSSVPDFDDDSNSATLSRPCVEVTVGAKTPSGVAEVRPDLLTRPNVYIYCELGLSDDLLMGLQIQSDTEVISTVMVYSRKGEGFEFDGEIKG